MPRHQRRGGYFLRVTDVSLFNTLYAYLERDAKHERVIATRSRGYYVLFTDDPDLWRELYLYGQLLAQAQGTWIEGGENS